MEFYMKVFWTYSLLANQIFSFIWFVGLDEMISNTNFKNSNLLLV